MENPRAAVRLRPVQLGVLARVDAGDDIAPFVAQALEHHPQAAAAQGDRLVAHVTALRELAFSSGLCAQRTSIASWTWGS